MTDTERLDALGDYGLCVAAHDSLNHDGWERCWVCTYSIGSEQRVIMGEDIRAVIDAAVLDLQTSNHIEH